MRENKHEAIPAIIFIIVMLGFALAMLATGCKTQYVPVETIKHDSIYISSIRVDSVFNRDSVMVYIQGDTTYIYKEKEVVRYQLKSDTTIIEKVDSVQVPYPVEKKLSRWEQIKMDMGGIAIGAVGVCALVLAIRIWLKLKSRKV